MGGSLRGALALETGREKHSLLGFSIWGGVWLAIFLLEEEGYY